MVNGTTIVMVHHLSTVKSSYTISVVHCGQIVEQGNLNFFITIKSILLSSKGQFYISMSRIKKSRMGVCTTGRQYHMQS